MASVTADGWSARGRRLVGWAAGGLAVTGRRNVTGQRLLRAEDLEVGRRDIKDKKVRAGARASRSTPSAALAASKEGAGMTRMRQRIPEQGGATAARVQTPKGTRTCGATHVRRKEGFVPGT